MICEDEVETGCTPAKRLKSSELKDEESDVTILASLKPDNQPRHSKLREEDMGIVKYISNLPGFHAVIKQRYSDFTVHEIDQSGNIVELKSLQVPDYGQTVNVENLQNVLPDSIKEQLNKIEDNSETVFEIPVDELSKDERRNYHQAIKSLYPSLCSNTDEADNGKKIIRVKRDKGGKEARSRNLKWPHPKAKYVRFTLYKENKGTIDAISLLCNFLRCRSNVFSFAGTKDKRARTSQSVTAFKVLPHKLAALNSRLRNMAIGDFEFVEKELKLGDLSGNRFTLVLRSVRGDPDIINESILSLKRNGFINYFGMQRFGTTDISTYTIGKSILLGNFKEAIDLLLTPQKCDNDEVRRAKESWQKNRDAKAALQELKDGKYRISVEYKLLTGLMQRPKNDLVGALSFLSDTNRLLYVHSYQSRLWNRIVSKRVEKFGFAVHVGDLIKDKDGDIKSITVENVLDYSIEDVVLPLPGYDIVLPENETSQWYSEMLAEDGLSLPALKHTVKSYSLSGSYRSVVVKPRSISWKFLQYKDVTQALVPSDLDKLNGISESSKEESSDSKEQTALLLTLTLPTSAYATMALREILKCDTSIAVQASMNE
ncbi:DgyrCDS13133 [Dimorphilus gyrociliatus]|uniref:DgyrCDS13133 n=1 Tax=Dimorphilus gyrociliatus TaxID=2664684 RepID=A0A7I8W9R5_9ANNE|nr:DgyrCDS13133 [Dimorphilus gyrociliatus]